MHSSEHARPFLTWQELAGIFWCRGRKKFLFPDQLNWLDKVTLLWPHIAAGFDFVAALLASIHTLLHKRDSRAATLWLGIIWFVPLFGPILYLALGVNRIRRRAIALGVHSALSRQLPDDLGEAGHEGAEHLKAM